MINETVFLGGCPVVRPEGIYYEGRRVIKLGLQGTEGVTWPTWYNSHASQQSEFDEAALALDDASTTPDQKQNYIDYFGGSDDEKNALRNYVATGGRRGLFAAPAKNYGAAPVSAVGPQGPIEKAIGANVTLHPGTYVYKATQDTAGAFDAWSQSNEKTVKRTFVKMDSATLPGSPYHVDYALTVYQDTLWPSNLLGNPTWLPVGADPIQYWAKADPDVPFNWGGLIPPLPKVPSWVVPVAVATVAVVGGALIIYYVPRRSSAPPEMRPT